MKLAAAGIILLESIALGSSTPEGAVLAERVHSRDVVKRAGRYCGTFTMACDRAGSACNNACYHINCQPGGGASRTMVYDSGNTKQRNLVQSGCQSSNSRSVCNSLPFSQAFHDLQNITPGDMSFNCDAWPMASIKQNDFVQGQVRNSLRCIDSSENSSGESQLQKFIQGATPDQGRPRTCPGAIQDGDFWQVEFDLTGANPSKTQHCADSGFCANDAFQFHMTAQRPGPYNFPYNPDTMNRYTQDGTPGGKDLLQCSVTVHRQLDTFFNIAVFDNMGTQKGTAALSAFSTAGPPVRVKGLPADLLFNRAGAFEADGGGTIFRYNSTFGLVWFGDAKGTSRDFQPGGEYCSVIGSGTTQQPVQDLKCYFPCPAA